MNSPYTNEHRWVVDGPVDGQDYAFRGAIIYIRSNPHSFDRVVDHNDPEDIEGFGVFKARHLRLFPAQSLHDDCYRRSCYMHEQLYIQMNEVAEPTPHMGGVRFLQKLYLILLEALGRTPTPDTSLPSDDTDSNGANDNADSDDDDVSDSDGSPDAGGEVISLPLRSHPSSVSSLVVVPQPPSNQASSGPSASTIIQSTSTGNTSSGTSVSAAPPAHVNATIRPTRAAQRAPRQCIECRLTHKGCDKGLPGCSRCAENGKRCRYGTTVAADRAGVTKSYRGDRGGQGEHGGKGGQGGRGGQGGSGNGIAV